MTYMYMHQTFNASFSCKWKRQKMVVIVVKRYAVREAEKWRYAVRKAKIWRYAVRKGVGGCHPHITFSPIQIRICECSGCYDLVTNYENVMVKAILKCHPI